MWLEFFKVNQGKSVFPRRYLSIFPCVIELKAGCILGDPRRPYPTDLEMRSGLLGQMNSPSTNGVNGHLPGDALAAGRLPGMCSSEQYFEMKAFFQRWWWRQRPGCWTSLRVWTHLILVAASAAKSLQSCPTLCDPIDGSPPGSPVPGIL